MNIIPIPNVPTSPSVAGSGIAVTLTSSTIASFLVVKPLDVFAIKTVVSIEVAVKLNVNSV